MLRHYLILLRTFWLGSLWSAAYVVRPLLEHRGYFPLHGLDVLNVSVALGMVCGGLILLLAGAYRVLSWRELPLQLLLTMQVLSLLYFALLPWWKLQMMMVHAVAVIGLVWLWLAPQSVIHRDQSPADD